MAAGKSANSRDRKKSRSPLYTPLPFFKKPRIRQPVSEITSNVVPFDPELLDMLHYMLEKMEIASAKATTSIRKAEATARKAEEAAAKAEATVRQAENMVLQAESIIRQALELATQQRDHLGTVPSQASPTAHKAPNVEKSQTESLQVIMSEVEHNGGHMIVLQGGDGSVPRVAPFIMDNETPLSAE